MYTMDNEDVLPTLTQWGYGESMWDRLGGTMATPTILSNQLESVKESLLWPFHSSEKILVCPKDAVEQKGSKKNLYNLRNIYVTSYIWNLSVIAYGKTPQVGGQYRTLKLGQFKATDILQWEADEMKPFFFNDSWSFPDEGISQRHGGGQSKNERTDVGGGASVGTYGGSAEHITYRRYYELAGEVDKRGRPLKDEELPNDLWNDPMDSKRGGAFQ